MPAAHRNIFGINFLEISSSTTTGVPCLTATPSRTSILKLALRPQWQIVLTSSKGIRNLQVE